MTQTPKVIIWIVLMMTGSLRSQSNPKFDLGVGINTNGFYLHGQRFGRSGISGWKRPQGPGFEIGNIFHTKEIALLNSAFPGTNIYKLGKVNYALALRSTYQFRTPLTYRSDKKSIAMNYVFSSGISMAYSWPVYIRYFSSDPDDGGVQVVRYDPEVHAQPLIYGRQSWTTKFGTGKFIPGLIFKSGLEFIWGSYFNNIKVIETGVRVEAFSQKLPILYRSNLNKQIYTGLYFNFAFGSSD